MYRELKKTEIEKLVEKYFSIWGNDIRKVTVISYDTYNEYLINDSVLFLENVA